ncbi:hypothetical protein [Schleiferilactobacillus shenzhenensis]|uniref:Uncharacterized protein n=1 Tax=Schleiferilactobacillus shenzhenensis LY-73 TaxID=1231336 RepID=U4TP12_9LACO|nr:hypothetical protein [Schleiferilactobacillus shenzhenensis]ERL65949.1 hypothetical protein L248_2025 [Schleiferilactobacillus shenzhenensis LY-73]
MPQTGHWFHDTLQKNKQLYSKVYACWPNYDAPTHRKNKWRFIDTLLFDGIMFVFAVWLGLMALHIRSWILVVLLWPLAFMLGAYIKWNVEDYRAYIKKWIQAGRPQKEPAPHDDHRSEPPQPPIRYHF